MGIREVEGGNNLSFVLEGTRILQTEYRIMQNHETASLLPCTQYKRDGADALCYITRGKRTFADVIRSASGPLFCRVTGDLFLNIARLQENGFLTCRRLNIDFHRIYVDRKTNRTSLLYIPADMVLFQSDTDFDRTLRESFARSLAEVRSGQAFPAGDFLRDLQDHTLSVSEIGERLQRRAEEGGRDGRESGRSGPGAEAVLTAVNTTRPVAFHICRDVYTIGRRGQTADGMIPDDRRVGRVHCRVYRSDGRFFLQDLGSVNGTFINGERMVPGRRHELTDGCSVGIAGWEFTVRIQKPEETR